MPSQVLALAPQLVMKVMLTFNFLNVGIAAITRGADYLNHELPRCT